MSSLASVDLESSLRLVRSLADIPSADQFAVAAVRGVGEVVHSDVSTYNDIPIDPAVPAEIVVEPLDADFDGSGEALARHQEQHPIIAYRRATGDQSAMRLSDFVSTRELHRTAVYAELFRPVGCEYQAAIILPVPDRVVGLALINHASDFSERDVDVLTLLRPYLAQAWRDARARSALLAIDGLLAQSCAAVVALDRHGVRYFTPRAAAVLRRWFSDDDLEGGLPTSIRRWLTATRRSRPLGSQRGWQRDGARLDVRYVPDGCGGCLILGEHLGAVEPSMLAALPLSPREREVLVHVTTSATNAQIAHALGVRERTVRKHLENIYRRLDVRSRAGAAAVARRAAAEAGPGDMTGRAT